jgi:hypothetical protein
MEASRSALLLANRLTDEDQASTMSSRKAYASVNDMFCSTGMVAAQFRLREIEEERLIYCDWWQRPSIPSVSVD